MGKFKDKLIKRVLKEKDKVNTGLSEFAVQNTIKKDLFNKSRSYKKEILRLFPMYLDSYVLICKYLYYDFGVRKTKFNNESTEIKVELDLKNQVSKILKDKQPARIRILDKFNYNKLIKKWWILSTILRNYKHALDLLKQNSSQNTYKDIDFDIEYTEYGINKYLIEDFDVLEK